jgi:hypothetical protein
MTSGSCDDREVNRKLGERAVRGAREAVIVRTPQIDKIRYNYRTRDAVNRKSRGISVR